MTFQFPSIAFALLLELIFWDLTNWITGTILTALSTGKLPMVLFTLSTVFSNNIGQTVTLPCHSVTSKPGKING